MAKRKFYRSNSNWKDRIKNFFLISLKVCFIGGFILMISGFFIFAYFAKELPDPEAALQDKVAETTQIYDRTGEKLLYEIHGGKNRSVVSPDKIPENIKKATVAVEDEDFYHHIGIDPAAILRAIWTDIKKGKLAQGGSTITQQFIKNSILSPERTFERKIKEVILALELEREYTKEEILTFYLNQIPYGGST